MFINGLRPHPLTVTPAAQEPRGELAARQPPKAESLELDFKQLRENIDRYRAMTDLRVPEALGDSAIRSMKAPEPTSETKRALEGELETRLGSLRSMLR